MHKDFRCYAVSYLPYIAIFGMFTSVCASNRHQNIPKLQRINRLSLKVSKIYPPMPPDRANSPPKRAPHIPKPYAHKPGPKAGKSTSKDTPRTSSFSNAPSSQQNLTLHDWLCVVNWFDENQPISQEAAVQHFATLCDEALIFNQASLSRHLSKKGRQQDQAKLASTPTSLSSKRIHVVTRPDVEQALRLWVEHMESKRETVSQPMLIEKRARFEDMLNVPEPQRL